MTEPQAWMDEFGTVLSAYEADGTGLRKIPLYLRNDILDEVAKEIEKFYPIFGRDTVYSFAAFVRNMKK